MLFLPTFLGGPKHEMPEVSVRDSARRAVLWTVRRQVGNLLSRVREDESGRVRARRRLWGLTDAVLRGI